MNFEHTLNIAEKLQKKFNFEIEVAGENSLQPQIIIKPKNLLEICKYLYSDSEQLFDLLNCITAIDNYPGSETIDLLYHFTSIPFQKSIIIKLTINRDLAVAESVETLSSIWQTAEWHEREIFDFFGIKFNKHPDLRRILLPADWQGHPLRKDYQEQEEYHGIKVKY